MNGPTRRLAIALFAGFALLLGSLTWTQVIAADRYRDDPRNARAAISESGKERGVIVTMDGTPLAQSVPIPDDPQVYQRIYPAGPAFAPVVGYASLLVGRAGLEQAFADQLRSRRDLTISDLIAALFGRDLRPHSLQTTIDPELQQVGYEALSGQRGAIVALHPQTGELLAYVSSPSYDPSLLTGTDAVAQRQTLLDDPAGPLLDRAGAELVRPGSTFKTVVAAAGFDSGLVGPDTELADPEEFALPGSSATISNFGGGVCEDGDTVTIAVAFVRSCNTVFADLAIQVGAEEINRTATGLGFNTEIPFSLPLAEASFPVGELAGDPAALGQSGIGERDVRATPLVMAMVAAAVANGGELMAPRLVSQVFDADGGTVEAFEPDSLGQPISPAAASALARLMERVVTEGTGRRASVAGVRVAGKTGTAENEDGAPDVWFIAFAPVEDPQIAVAVLVEDGGEAGDTATGGSVAGPIAAVLIESWLSRDS